MRPITIVAMSICLLAGCDLGDAIGHSAIQIDFTLLNTAGRRSVIFVGRDTITVHFALTNNSGKALPYHYTGTPIVLKITKADAAIATSVDGLVFVQIVRGGVLETGQSVVVDWRLPNATLSGQTSFLSPGSYQAVVLSSGMFDSFQMNRPEPIQFTVYAGNV